MSEENKTNKIIQEENSSKKDINIENEILN